jgi:hypothetical protein
LAYRIKELSPILDISISLSAASEADQILDVALNKVMGHLDYDAEKIYLTGRNPVVLKLAACRGLCCQN